MPLSFRSPNHRDVRLKFMLSMYVYKHALSLRMCHLWWINNVYPLFEFSVFLIDQINLNMKIPTVNRCCCFDLKTGCLVMCLITIVGILATLTRQILALMTLIISFILIDWFAFIFNRSAQTRDAYVMSWGEIKKKNYSILHQTV